MEINQTIINSKSDKIFASLKRVSRISLIISSALLFISVILLLVYKGECFSFSSKIGSVIWFAILVAIYSIFYSLIVIVVFFIYQIYKRHLFWSLIKREIVLLILTSILMAIFYFVNFYTIKNFY